MTKKQAILTVLSTAALCMGGAALDRPLAGPLDSPLIGPLIVALGVVAASFRLADPVRQLGLATLVALLGTGLETGLIVAGIYLPRGMTEGSVLCPLWVIAMWVVLGLCAPAFTPKDWRGYIPLAVGGALIAPLFYLAADLMPGAALHLKRPLWPTLILLALLWQGVWPGICWLANDRWYRVRDTVE